MADEAKLLTETEPAVSVTISDASGIPKGTVLALTDPETGAASTADNDIFGGITKREKIALNGHTRLAVYFGGIFRMTVAGGQTATVGKQAVIKGANTVGDYTTLDNELGYVVGRFLETAAAGETVRVFVGK